ncbi:hypothetical protein SRHO_G00216270 [Serrasalmus rhombeus]
MNLKADREDLAQRKGVLSAVPAPFLEESCQQRVRQLAGEIAQGLVNGAQLEPGSFSSCYGTFGERRIELPTLCDRSVSRSAYLSLSASITHSFSTKVNETKENPLISAALLSLEYFAVEIIVVEFSLCPKRRLLFWLLCD